ncbi:hypothetical protein FOZ62_024227 [Perkinsus olseni]|uniref:Uncharacterized protein n=1 Tax=Perkinsus olseni TaxID=32597 RepID=A0A7J6U5J0_PEROL|nr:hypothetical protein FOZ62_024227 [Perkinsus olseni]
MNSSSIRGIKLRLNLAASKIQFRPDLYADTPGYDDEPTFFNENGDEATSSGGDDEEPEELQSMFDAKSKYNYSTASTELPIEELQEVCSAAMDLVTQRFENFVQLCAAHYKALNAVFGRDNA